MKMDPEKCRKIFYLLLKIVLFYSIVNFSVGCSTTPLVPSFRPKLSSNPYHVKEALGVNVIKKDYPKWNYPSYLGGVNSSVYEKTENNSFNKFDPAKETIAPFTLSSVTTEQEITSVSRNSTGRYDPIENEENYHSKISGSVAIVDDAPLTPPAAHNKSFEIVPENQFPHNTRIVTIPALPRYTVQKNDTLMQIARKLYRDDSAWKRIYHLNRDVLTNPDHIQPGMTLVIPE